jgi:hypothetical protein
MTLPCPHCEKDLKVKVHAMLTISRDKYGHLDEIKESQWEVL